MRTSTKIWLIIAIITNLAMLYFFNPLINALHYTGGYITIQSTWETYVALGIFILANISGGIIIIRFIKSQPFSRQIFFSTLFPTITFVSLFLFFFNITTMQQIGIVTIVRDSLNINTSTSRYIWMGIVSAIYAIYLLITYAILSKPIRKLEKTLQQLKYNETFKQPIKIGGSREFKSMEEDLKIINNELNKVNLKNQ